MKSKEQTLYLRHCLIQSLQGESYWGNVLSLCNGTAIKRTVYYASTTQQERNYFRQLKSSMSEIIVLDTHALHAYQSLRHAVKANSSPLIDTTKIVLSSRSIDIIHPPMPYLIDWE